MSPTSSSIKDEYAGEYKRFISSIIPPHVSVTVEIIKPYYPTYTSVGPKGYEIEFPEGEPYTPKSWVWMTREALRIKFGLVYDIKVNQRICDRVGKVLGHIDPAKNYRDLEMIFIFLGNLFVDQQILEYFPGIPYEKFANEVLHHKRIKQDLPTPDQIPEFFHGFYRWAWGTLFAQYISVLKALFPNFPSELGSQEKEFQALIQQFLKAPTENLLQACVDLVLLLHAGNHFPFLVPDPRDKTKIDGTAMDGDFSGRGGRRGDIFTDFGNGNGEGETDREGMGVKIGQGGKISRSGTDAKGKIIGFLSGEQETTPVSLQLAEVQTFETAGDIAEYMGKTIAEGEQLYERLKTAFGPYIEALRTSYFIHKNILSVKRNQPQGRLLVSDAISMRAEHRLKETSSRLPFRKQKTDYGDAILFLVDLSGSMRGVPMKILQSFVVIMAEVLRDTPTKFAIVGSGALPQALQISEVIFKNFLEAPDPEKLGLVDVSLKYCENRDSDILLECAKYFEGDIGDAFTNRRVVVINDELPNHVGLSGEEGQRATLEALTRLRNQGIQVYGISFNSRELAFLREFFGNQHFIRVEPFPDPTAGGSVSYQIMMGIQVREYFFDVLYQLNQMCDFVLEILNEG